MPPLTWLLRRPPCDLLPRRESRYLRRKLLEPNLLQWLKSDEWKHLSQLESEVDELGRWGMQLLEERNAQRYHPLISISLLLQWLILDSRRISKVQPSRWRDCYSIQTWYVKWYIHFLVWQWNGRNLLRWMGNIELVEWLRLQLHSE